MRAKRVCNVVDCPELTDSGRCDEHRREHDRTRGTTYQRGYDRTYDRTRRRWQQRLDAGEPITCWRGLCGNPIDPHHWHLGHDDHDRAVIRGPECPSCNLAAAGRASHRT